MSGVVDAHACGATEPSRMHQPPSLRWHDDVLSVPVLYRKGEAMLKYARKTRGIMLQRIDRKGNLVKILSIHTWNAVNIETQEEALLRELRRSGSDKCFGPEASGDAENGSFQLARKPSMLLGETVGLNLRTASGTSFTTFRHSRSSSGAKTATSTIVAGTLYQLYYVKDASRSIRQLSKLEFSSLPEPENERNTRCVVREIFDAVYPQGVKTLLFFVSPKSGSGNAVGICRRQILPLLRFSQHEVNVVVTKYAGHCEDYVADITNDLSDRHVIVAVGGDGMVHEVVNGMLRRWRAAPSGDLSVKGENELNEKVKKMKKTTSWRWKPNDATQHTGKHENVGVLLSDIDEKGRGWLQKGEGEGVAKLGWIGGGEGASAQKLELGSSVCSQLASKRPLFPMIATIPAGSGCGLSKTLNASTIHQSVLALIHLDTCVKDLMGLRYVPRGCTSQVGGEEAPPPPVNHHHHISLVDQTDETETVGMSNTIPTTDSAALAERIASMSVTFGVINDIDRGSEKLRWMGNSRFTTYAAFLLLRGMRAYRARMRYLPWTNKQGQQLLKLRGTVLPSETEFPRCTLTRECTHCRLHVSTSSATGFDRVASKNGCTSSHGALQMPGVNEHNEQQVDFDDNSLPWVTLEGGYYSIFIGNTRHATKDVIMTPLAHLSDGAIDVTYTLRGNAKGSRVEFLNFFRHLETGKQVNLPFVSYVKVRAIELEALEGNIMADGEIMPFEKVRITSLRSVAEFVRGL